MAVTLLLIGWKPPSGRDSDYGEMISGNLRASVYYALSSHYWITRIAAIVGHQGSTATIQLAVYDSDGDPNTLLGRTGDISITTAMSSASGGQEAIAALAYSNMLSTKGALLRSNVVPSVAIFDKTGAIRHGFRPASAWSDDVNKNLYTASGQGSVPTSYPAVSGEYEGWVSAWFEAYPNEAPQVPLFR